MNRLFATLPFAVWLLAPCVTLAQGSDYLAYQEPKPQVSLLSGIDTIVYMVTVFALILGLAYLATRLVGKKLAVHPPGLAGDAVLGMLSLGPNKALYLVQFAGRLLILGVSEQKIELLADMTDTPGAAELKSTYQFGGIPSKAPQFSTIFQTQLTTLRQMSDKFPHVFGRYADVNEKTEHDREKR